MSYHIEEMISEEAVEARVNGLAAQINADYAGRELHMVIILKGSVFFATELAKRVTVPVTMDFMTVTSYGDGMVSAGEITVKKELDEDITGKEVLIIEDIVDSGRTLYYLKRLLLARDPASLKIVTLLDKPERRTVEIQADYYGFEIPDRFVVGYGLDYAQRHRNLPYVGVIIQDEEGDK
ncbi:MAG: hypoxanthine phosphoribosyltransferase [Lachnospiraceae bacterium]|nr:hypoxanthine phosphoribosyltransferase [Lachnospiraceae bacterium]